MLVDRFAAVIATLIAEGWVITAHHRYEPTTVAGVTPGGRSFSASFSDAGCEITVAGRTQSLVLAKSAWLEAEAAGAVLRDLWHMLPVTQR